MLSRQHIISGLIDMRYAEGGGAFGDSFTEKLTYNKNSSILTLQRYGANNILIDDMSYSYNGNRVTQIVDTATSDGFPVGATWNL